jgi:polyisoprenoid-binding protein YceI
MKKVLFPLAAVAILAACNNASDADKAATGEKEAAALAEGVTYTIDSANSTINWAATKVNGAHNGTFKLTQGSLAAKDSVLTGGNFTIDITSVNVVDLAADTVNKGKLEGHLSSPDFFDVAKYPTAKFEITAVEPFVYDSTTMKNVVLKNATHTVKGNLTLRDSTKNVTFPAIVAISDDTVSAEADFNIDRTEWGLNYKGPNNPADWLIRKEVNLKFKIAAAKK